VIFARRRGPVLSPPRRLRGSEGVLPAESQAELDVSWRSARGWPGFDAGSARLRARRTGDIPDALMSDLLYREVMRYNLARNP
jgi:hypothetical protein